MLDYNTLNNLVEIFKKQGVRGVTLENGSTLEIKDGALLVNGKSLGGVKVIDTDNITALSTETIEGLSAGDIVVKHTGEQTHTYIVTYKEEHQGICISYFAAGYSETVSYDYVTDAWVYNSTDIVTPKEPPKFYMHNLIVSSSGISTVKFKIGLTIINQSNTALTASDIISYLENAGLATYDASHGYTNVNGRVYSDDRDGVIIGIGLTPSKRIYFIYTYVQSQSAEKYTTGTLQSESWFNIDNDLIIEL